MSRGEAIARVERYFDSGALRDDLAVPAESQNPDRAAVLTACLEAEIGPAFEVLACDAGMPVPG